MADLSHLGDLVPSEAIDLDALTPVKASGSGGRPVPPPGRYTVRAPESFPATSFGRSKAGALLSQIDPTVVGGDFDGYNIRFVKVSAKPFQQRRKIDGVEKSETTSQVAQYLKACGQRGTMPTMPQDIANAVERTAGQLYEIETDWKVWDKFSQVEYTLRENPDMFAKDDAGNALPFITVKDSDGNDFRLRANVEITRFISAS